MMVGGVKISTRIFPRERRGGHTHKNEKSKGVLTLQGIEVRKMAKDGTMRGGSSMGYKLAGFDVVGNCEIDPDMMKVYKQNNHPKHSYLMDVRDFLKLPDEKMPDELFHL